MLSVTLRTILAALLCLSAGSADAKKGSELRTLSPDGVIKRYGKPDTLDSTEFDDPRPPLVMKWLVYEHAKVQFVFVPDGPLGAAPPYKSWTLGRIIDPTSKEELDDAEVTRRFRAQHTATPAIVPTPHATAEVDSRFMRANQICAMATMGNPQLRPLDRPILCGCVAERVKKRLGKAKKGDDSAEFALIKNAVIAELPNCYSKIK